jgi:hypothetical protein
MIVAILLISCSKSGSSSGGTGTDTIIIPPSTQEPKITIFSKSQCILDTIIITLPASNQISQIEHRKVSICNGEKYYYKDNYSYDTDGRLTTATSNNPNTLESRIQYYYATKIFSSGLAWDTAKDKKTGISKIRVDLRENSSVDINHWIHNGDSVILQFYWTHGRSYVGTVGTWDPAYGVSSTGSNTYPLAIYPETFQRYSDYAWSVDTANLIQKSVSSSGNKIRTFIYNTSGELISADYKTRNVLSTPFVNIKQMDIVWENVPPFLPSISKGFKDVYWIGNTQFPLFDPIRKFDIEYSYGSEASTDINFILANMKSIDYDYHTKSYSFENTYTNGLLTHKIVRNNNTHAATSEFTISYSF